MGQQSQVAMFRAAYEKRSNEGLCDSAGGAEYKGEIGIPVQCCGAVVQPGDWIVSDEDGLVVVPSARLEATLALAKRLRDVERQIYRAVRAGEDLATLLRYDELMASKSTTGGLPQMRFSKEG